MRSAIAILFVLALATACDQAPAPRPPEPGATSQGEVRLEPDGDLAGGERITVGVHADDPGGVVGGACIRLYRWEPGFGPFPLWLIDARSGDRWHFDEHTQPSEYDEAVEHCPATGVELPDNLTFVLPELDDGTYELTYTWTIVRTRPPGRPGEAFRSSYAFVVGK